MDRLALHSYIYMKQKVKRLAQADTRSTFERLLSKRFSRLVEIYELMLEDLMQQPAELATLAKNTLKKIIDAGGPVNIHELTSALASELTGIASARDTSEGTLRHGDK